MRAVPEFGKQLKEYRKRKDMKQSTLAKIVGVTPQTISAYENGNKSPSLDIAIAISDALDVSLNSLCGLRAAKKARTVFEVTELITALQESVNTSVEPIDCGTPDTEIKGLEIQIKDSRLYDIYTACKSMTRFCLTSMQDLEEFGSELNRIITKAKGERL